MKKIHLLGRLGLADVAFLEFSPELIRNNCWNLDIYAGSRTGRRPTFLQQLRKVGKRSRTHFAQA